MNHTISKEFLFDYFNGHATVLQKKLISDWVKIPENEEMFYRCLCEWEMSHPQYLTNVPDAIERYRKVADDFENATAPDIGISPPTARRTTYPFMPWLRVACILVVMACVWTYQERICFEHYETAAEQIQSWKLRDGTEVTLNSNSLLKVPRYWTDERVREVYLTGEAEFNVTHKTDNSKFVVKTTNALDVVVLGTVFTVFSRSKRAQVILNKGKVLLERSEGKNKEQIMMAPGDKVTMQEGKKLHVEERVDTVQFAMWKEHRFVFDKTPLTEVAQMIRDNYNLNVKISDREISDLKVSGSFKALNANELLQSISRILGIRFTRHKNTVVFSRNS
jgi:transmembrane sensor